MEAQSKGKGSRAQGDTQGRQIISLRSHDMARLRLHPKHFRKRYRLYKPKPLSSLASPRLKRRRQLTLVPRPNVLRALKRIGAFLGIAVLAVGFIYLIFFSASMKVEKIIVVRDGQKISGGALARPLQDLVGKNILFVNLRDYEHDLRSAHTMEFKLLEIDRELPDTIRIQYSEFPPAANFTFTQSGVQRKFLVNENGLLTEEDTEDQALPYIRFMGEITDENELALGGIAVDSEHLAKITKAAETFIDRFGMQVREALYYPIEREAHLRTERDFLVWLDLEQDVLRQLSKLKQALPQINIYELNLSYIDLRIAGTEGSGAKVIYKKK